MGNNIKTVRVNRLRKNSERFNLRRYFSVFSVLIILLLTIILSGFVYWSQKKSLTNYSISMTEIFAEQLTRRINDDFIDANLKEYGYLNMVVKSPMHQVMDNISAKILYDYSEIIKFKIFNLGGKIIYSTDSKDIGVMSNHEKLRSALSGIPDSKLTKRKTELWEDTSEKGKWYEVDLLEVYVPIYSNIDSPSKDQIIGAFEIYKDISPLYSLMKQEFYKIPIMLMFAMSALYLFLQIVVKNANRIINKQNAEIDQYNSELEDAQKRIKESIDEVIENESFNVRFQSKQTVRCWEIKGCSEIECPCFGETELKCWQVAGTFCKGEVQGIFASKYGDCRHCEVYNAAFEDRIDMIGESFNNMMILLESKHHALQEANEKLNMLVDIDPLTQVGNRRSFHKKMEYIHLMSLRYNRPYSLIICDIDNFKTYNDSYGHQQGDYALVSTSKTMKEMLRKTDEIFRWGGEEFVIVLPEQNHSSALKVAENLRKSIQALGIKHEKSSSRILTMSFGVASNFLDRVNYISWDAVLREADEQMYIAKSNGKNCVYSLVKRSGTGRV